MAKSVLPKPRRSAAAVATSSPALQDVGLLLLRVFTGLMLMRHGFQKLPPPARFIESIAELGLPQATAFAWAAGLSEFLGGLLLALGLLTRTAALFLIGTMAVAAFGYHRRDPLAQKELSLTYLLTSLLFLLGGPGRYAFGRIFTRAQ